MILGIIFALIIIQSISATILRSVYYSFLRKNKIPHDSYEQFMFNTRVRIKARDIKIKYIKHPIIVAKMIFFIKWAKINIWFLTISLLFLTIYIIYN